MIHFCKVEVRNGESTSFWYSSMGCLMDGTGPRGEIDMGIGKNDAVLRQREEVTH